MKFKDQPCPKNKKRKEGNNLSPISDDVVFFVNGISLTRPPLTNFS